MSEVLTEDMVLSRSRATSLDDVKKLNYWASNLGDISVLKQMPNIQILTLSVNNISTLKDLENCTHLVELYIRNNTISDINEVWFLRNLKKLKILWLADNPCALDKDYRLIVLKMLPGLTKLDSAVVTPEELELARNFEFEFKIADNNEDKSNDGNFEAVLTHLINDFKSLDESTSAVPEETDKNDNEAIDATNTQELANTSDAEEPQVTDGVGNSCNTVANSVQFTNGGGEVDSKRTQFTRMSVEETNKLRLELGLKPLPAHNNVISATNVNQSPNVLAAVLSLVKDLNVDGLDMVIGACQYRKELLKNIFYEEI